MMHKRNRKKRLSVIAMSLLMVFSTMSLPSCGKGTQDQTLSMYIGLGNVKNGYYEKIQKAVEENTGVKLNYVSSSTMDTTNSMVNKIQNNDLPADIIITASKTENEYCKNSLLDLASYTNLSDSFNSAEIEQFATKKGEVYQLPFTTRLIGIEYNKTLLKEMGWELPKTYDEMVALKAKADAAGIKFAVSGGAATGHGFNYLFHTMGADYLVKPDGTEWFSGFRSGKLDASEFAKKAAYFQKYVEAGLFGDFHDEDWLAYKQFSEERALFYYNILNDVYSYDGYQYNEDGTIVGAKYSADGTLVAEKKTDGEAVLVDEQYVLYDKNNEEHKGLERYTIPGAVILHDKYGSMPWMSEDGNTNCFTEYHNMFIGINKELGEKGNEKKLAAAIAALEFMLSEKSTDLFSETCPDGIVLTNDYLIKNDRLYYEYADPVRKGYRMPWYYNYFDPDSITNVGAKVNAYIKGDSSVDMKSIINELEERNAEYLKGNVEILTKVEDTLEYKDDARLQAIANRLAANAALVKSGQSGEVELALLPYIEDSGDITEQVTLPVVQEKIYKGNLEKSKLSSYVNSLTNDVAIVKLSGKEVNKLLKNGFDASIDFSYEHVFKMLAVSKGDVKIKDGKDYLVAIPEQVLPAKKFEEYKKSGNVIMKDGEPVKATTIDGLNKYLKNRDSISADTI